MNKNPGLLKNVKKESEILPIDEDDEIDLDYVVSDLESDIKDEPIKLKTKKCSICAETKLMSDFYSKGAQCKKCMCAKSKATKHERKEGFRVCSTCQVNKSTDNFYSDSHDTQGIQGTCKDCQKESTKKKSGQYKETNKNKAKDDLPEGIVKCSDKECTGNKEAKDFVRDSHSKNGLQSSCKECRARHKTGKVLANINIDPNITKKSCNECEIELFLTEFNKSDSGIYGYDNSCRTCKNTKRRQETNKKPDEGTKKCSTCNEEKLYTEFYACKESTDGAEGPCKLCRNKIFKKHFSTYNGHMSNLYKDLINNAKVRNIQVDITKEDILELDKQQNGYCAMTGILMTHDRKNRDDKHVEHNINKYNISVDRKDSKIHYTKDNIQLVCAAINRIKYCYNVDEFIEMCKKVVLTKNNQFNNVNNVALDNKALIKHVKMLI